MYQQIDLPSLGVIVGTIIMIIDLRYPHEYLSSLYLTND